MQPEHADGGDALEAGAVLRFLNANPEFFDQHQDVLPRLRIPHVSGRAVSLIERQVSVLRGKCSSLEQSLRELIGVARANEQLQGRLHGLVRDIVSAASLDVVVASTRRSLSQGFGADAVHVLLVDPLDAAPGASGGVPAATPPEEPGAAPSGAAPSGGGHDPVPDEPDDGGYRRLRADDARLACFEELFAAGGTRCGLPDAAQLDVLLGGDHAAVGSAALIPLVHERPLGLVMLSSRDESRFAAGKGVVFLDQLGEVLSRRVHTLGRDAS